VSGRGRPPSAYTIERVVATWQRSREALLADRELANDEQAIIRQLDVDPETVHPDALIERLVRAIAFTTGRREETKAFELMLAERRRRYEKRLEDMRTDLFTLMQLLEYRSFPALAGTVSLRKGAPSVLVTDEEAIPDEYKKVKKYVQKKKLLDDLKQGVLVEGAFLSNGAEGISVGRFKPVNEQLGETDDEAQERDGESGEPAPGADDADGGED
jgi:hypothetical protein